MKVERRMSCTSKEEEKNNQMGPCVCQAVSKGEGRKRQSDRATRMSCDENFSKEAQIQGFECEDAGMVLPPISSFKGKAETLWFNEEGCVPFRGSGRALENAP